MAFVGVADNVTGPYGHITWLEGAGCDSTLFVDDDGKTYAIMPFGDTYIQEADLTLFSATRCRLQQGRGG